MRRHLDAPRYSEVQAYIGGGKVLLNHELKDKMLQRRKGRRYVKIRYKKKKGNGGTLKRKKINVGESHAPLN